METSVFKASIEKLFNSFTCCRDSIADELRGQVSSLSPSSFRSAFDPDEVCGIGLVFKADQTGALFVSTVVPLGPAHLSGQVRQGDILYEVDGVNLYRQPASACASRLMGLRGTHITVCFLRDGQPLEVHLVRERIDSQLLYTTRDSQLEAMARAQMARSPHREHDFGRSAHDGPRQRPHASSPVESHAPSPRTQGDSSSDWRDVASSFRVLDLNDAAEPPLVSRFQLLKPAGGSRSPDQSERQSISDLSGTVVGEREGPNVGANGDEASEQGSEDLEEIKRRLDRQSQWIDKLFVDSNRRGTHTPSRFR